MARDRRTGGRPRSRRRRNFVIGLLALLAFGLFLYRGLPSFATSIAALIPPETEQRFGERMLPSIIAAFTGQIVGQNVEHLMCDETSGTAALDILMQPVTDEAGSHVPFRIHVIDNGLINAAALPGGHIILFRGMIDFADSGEELVSILAHEAAHVAARHPIEKMITVGGAALVFSIIAGDSGGGSLLAGIAQLLVSNGYSQQAENEADVLALQILQDARISPSALGNLLDRVAQEQGDLTGIFSYLSTHPPSAGRAERAHAAADGETGDPILSEAEWSALKNICGETDSDS